MSKFASKSGDFQFMDDDAPAIPNEVKKAATKNKVSLDKVSGWWSVLMDATSKKKMPDADRVKVATKTILVKIAKSKVSK
jgi:hypothetical protein